MRRPARIEIRPRDEEQGVYIISVAARILELHPQTLRKYERAGLVSPFRTGGMLRLYSEDDMVRLRLIKYLVGELKLNLAGVELMLDVFNQLLKLKGSIGSLEGRELKVALERTLDQTFAMLSSRV